MRRIVLAVFALIGLSSGFALASPRTQPEEPAIGCSGYKTWQTCNADPRCMWYGLGVCGPKID